MLNIGLGTVYKYGILKIIYKILYNALRCLKKFLLRSMSNEQCLKMCGPRAIATVSGGVALGDESGAKMKCTSIHTKSRMKKLNKIKLQIS